MKILRNSVSLLCILALLLSLAPCAFAEGTTEAAEAPISITKTETGEKKDGGTVYEAAGNVLVDRDGAITVYDNNGSQSEDPSAKAEVKIDGALTNLGYIQTMSTYMNKTPSPDGETSSESRVEADSIVNAGTLNVISSGGQNNTSELKTTSGDLTNDIGDNILVSSGSESSLDQAGEAKITVEGNLMNNGKITVASEGTNTSNATITATGDITNYGEIHILANPPEADGTWEAGITSKDGKVKNYNIIYMTTEEENAEPKVHIYFGVNYATVTNETPNMTMVMDTALSDWTDGKSGNNVSVTINDFIPTRAGYDFGGWSVGVQELAGLVFRSGDMVSFDVNDVTYINAIWNAMANNTPIPTGDSGDSDYTAKTEKSGEKIVKYMDGCKVLDADRRELEPETEYYKVAKTSYNRLIVVFTWQQMAEMEEGEHLFYIVQPDGIETEYTLTIW